jgi:UDP-N-acetylglucosamine--N-acetylmuramyl-(pentapeptide) pyrophosphoryl-undecaprenol N-acetylglucosamine transferase
VGNYRFILSGGGTGGHIYPAIAIANELKLRFPGAEFLFVGARGRMEMEKVPQAGYKIEGLWISGIQRKITLKNLLFPLKLISSLIRARGILKRFKPDAVIGTGGFASGPLLRMAAARGIPNVLQEQNSIAGMTNKWLASRADKICVAYDNMERFFPKNKIVKTGNPVRDHILAVDADQGISREFFQLDPDRPTLLIIGGSLGARRINELIASKLDFFDSEGLQLIWQCGRSYFDTYKTCCSGHVKVFDFINRMDLAYDAADIIISRAGAGSVSELCIVGKPVIFIPSPNVAEDHQTRNAEALVKKNAALMLKESDLEENFDAVFSRMKNSDEERNQLSSEIKNLALPNATIEIVDQIENIIRKKQEDS